MDITHNRAEVRVPHDRGERERVDSRLSCHSRPERMAQIVKHERNKRLAAGAVMGIGEFRDRLANMPLRREEPWTAAFTPAFQDLERLLRKVDSPPHRFRFAGNDSEGVRLLVELLLSSAGDLFRPKSLIDHETPDIEQIVSAGLVDDFLSSSKVRPFLFICQHSQTPPAERVA
jgi:hypothetical protein